MTAYVVSLLTEKSGVDYKNYATSSLQRRIDNIVLLRFKGNYTDFADFINHADKQQLNELINTISVNTTEFYRDWGVWNALAETVIPKLKTFPTIRIWHAGCSTGEEVYSMAILLAEMGLSEKVKIVATDISEKALQKAKSGEFSEKVIEQNEENINAVVGISAFRKYFTIENQTWTRDKTKLPEISFMRKDLSNMEAFSKFDIILCRNVMIYFNPLLQQRIIELFSKSLFKNGFLVTGKKESTKLVCDVKGFSGVNNEERIFSWYDE